MSTYDKTISKRQPSGVIAALEEGYIIVHKGILVSIPKPVVSEAAQQRHCMVLLEALMTFALGAATLEATSMIEVDALLNGK